MGFDTVSLYPLYIQLQLGGTISVKFGMLVYFDMPPGVYLINC